jgi:hypothetical protein
MRQTLRRELRVMFSRRGQPVWFRIIKWVVIIALAIAFWRRPAFWYSMLSLLIAAIPIHLLYRQNTVGWRRPWGGWHDVVAGR